MLKFLNNSFYDPQENMKTIVFVAAFMLSFFVISAPNAAMYYWVDESGVKNFSNDPPPKGVEYKIVGEEIASEPSADEQTQAEETKALDALIKDLDETEKEKADAEEPGRQAETQSGANNAPTRQEIIEKERKKLEDTIEHLQNLPPQSFANSRSRNVIIGEYQYKLSQLNSSPKNYFGW